MFNFCCTNWLYTKAPIRKIHSMTHVSGKATCANKYFLFIKLTVSYLCRFVFICPRGTSSQVASDNDGKTHENDFSFRAL